MSNVPVPGPNIAAAVTPEAIYRHRWLFLILGIVLILIGLGAFSYTFLFTVLAVEVYGWLLILGGGLQVVQAFWSRTWGMFFLHILCGLLSLIVGVLVVARPILGAVALTLLLGVYFLLGGAFRFGAAFSGPPGQRGWAAFSGIVDLILGVLLLSGWPGDSPWVIGLFVGINLLFSGTMWVVLALSLPKPQSS